jgi:hypothetical protein
MFWGFGTRQPFVAAGFSFMYFYLTRQVNLLLLTIDKTAE